MKDDESKEPAKTRLDTFRFGKDEMNLVEYSFSSATKQVDFKTRSVSFSKIESDPGTAELVERRLKMSFSAEYGRPTIEDDELYLGMMLLTKLAGCNSPTVSFTQYELIEAARLTKRGDIYRRIDLGFNRLKGVQFDFKRAFYDKAAKCWVDRKFGLIDDVKTYNRREWDQFRQSAGGRPRGWFKWGDALFESFVAGYIKTLDLDVYHSLQGNIARKLFRWFDKEWHHKQKLWIDLHELAEEKLGAKPGQSRSDLLRLVRPGLDELAAKGLVAETRFTDFRNGRTEVEVRRPKLTTTANLSAEQQELAAALLARGVKRNRKTGPEEIVDRCTPQRIRRVLEEFDFLKNTSRPKAAGWIVSACLAEDEFESPKGFVSQAAKQQQARKAQEALATQRSKESAELSRQASERRDGKARDRFVQEHLASLSQAGEQALEQEAVATAPTELRQAFIAAKRFGGVFYQKVRIELLFQFLTSSAKSPLN